jgi:hypothetical protein
MSKRIFGFIAILAMMVFGIGQIGVAEDSANVTISAVATIQSGCTLTLSPLSLQFVIPPPTSPADEGQMVPQTSPAITGTAIWKFVVGHRVAFRTRGLDPVIMGTNNWPFSSFVSHFDCTVTGTPTSGPAISFVDQHYNATGDTEIYVGTGGGITGTISDLNITYRFKRELAMGAGDYSWSLQFQLFDIV